MEAVYIHIPFCKSICSYCDFCKVLYNETWVNNYLDALKKEITERYNGETIKTLYIGGGTPSSLSSSALIKLFDLLKIIKLNADYEFTYECNINDLTSDFLNYLKLNGVNRLSIGIESFNKNKLAFMKRDTDFKDAQAKIKLCRQIGFNNLNLDLIYGLPHETIHTLKKDVLALIKLHPEHISTYSLIIEDNTLIGINKMLPIDEDTDYEMYYTICNMLKHHGYTHYEVSNFCLLGFASLHNTNYWLNQEYYGFGLGASGYIGNIRYENTRSLTKYLNGTYLFKENLLSKEEDMDNFVMLGFRLLKGINLQTFYNRFQINFQEHYDIQKLLNEKHLIYDDGYLKINPKEIYIMNEILIKII
jgi:oxygen-independent coproporphyrinogen III oxidase